MKLEVHPENLVNMAKDAIAVAQVNVDKAVTIGHNQLIEFEKSLLTGFWKPIERKIKIMEVGKRELLLAVLGLEFFMTIS